MNLGEAIVHFKGDDKKLQGVLSGLSKGFKNLGKTVAGVGLTSFTASLGTLAVMTKKSVMATGELEQQLGGAEAVFEEYADTIKKNGVEAFDKLGLSQNDYLQTANKIGSLMQGSGLDTKKSLDLTTKAMQRAGDVASVMGIDTQSAMEAITGAAKGNFTMMDNLGVAMNATNLEAYALSKGIKTSYTEMTQAEKVSLAYQMFLEKTEKYAGNYAKENETFAGSLNTLKASFENFLSGAGDIDSVIESMKRFGTILTNSLIKIVPQLTTGLVQLIQALIPQIPMLLQALIPPLIEGAITLTQALLTALPTLLPILLDGLFQIISAITEQLPTFMPMIVEFMIKLTEMIIKNIPMFIAIGLKMIGYIIVGLVNSVGKLFEWFIGLPGRIANKIKDSAVGKMASVGKNLISGMWKGLTEKWDNLKEKVANFGKGIVGKFKKIFGISSPSKEFAKLGKFNMMGLEKGMEDYQPKVQRAIDGMFNLNPSVTGSMSQHLSPTILVNNQISMETDPLGQVVNKIKTYSGGAKNDYNWGTGL